MYFRARSPGDAARGLAAAGGWEFEEIVGTGHAIPIERPLAWRKPVSSPVGHKTMNGR